MQPISITATAASGHVGDITHMPGELGMSEMGCLRCTVAKQQLNDLSISVKA